MQERDKLYQGKRLGRKVFCHLNRVSENVMSSKSHLNKGLEDLRKPAKSWTFLNKGVLNRAEQNNLKITERYLHLERLTRKLHLRMKWLNKVITQPQEKKMPQATGTVSPTADAASLHQVRFAIWLPSSFTGDTCDINVKIRACARPRSNHSTKNKGKLAVIYCLQLACERELLKSGPLWVDCLDKNKLGCFL